MMSSFVCSAQPTCDPPSAVLSNKTLLELSLISLGLAKVFTLTASLRLPTIWPLLWIDFANHKAQYHHHASPRGGVPMSDPDF